MAVPGWYNENSLRHYPLLDTPVPMVQVITLGPPSTVRLPTQLLVDFGSSIDSPLFTDPAASVGISLYGISRSSSLLTFTFANSGTGMDSVRLAFTRSVNDAPWTTSFASVTTTDVLDNVLTWRGFLVTGPLAPLLALLPSAGVLTPVGTLLLEPSTTRTLAGSYVRRINLTNYDRLRVSVPGYAAPAYSPGVIPGAVNIKGDVRWVEGWNLSIRQNDTDNSLTFSAAVGAGAGVTCGEIPLSDSEMPPEGSIYLDGSPACNQMIAAITGQSSANIKLLGIGGVTVAADQSTPATINISFDGAQSQNCISQPVAALQLVAIPPGVQVGS